jgi:hypothetical protein
VPSRRECRDIREACTSSRRTTKHSRPCGRRTSSLRAGASSAFCDGRPSSVRCIRQWGRQREGRSRLSHSHEEEMEDELDRHGAKVDKVAQGPPDLTGRGRAVRRQTMLGGESRHIRRTCKLPKAVFHENQSWTSATTRHCCEERWVRARGGGQQGRGHWPEEKVASEPCWRTHDSDAHQNRSRDPEADMTEMRR